MKTESAEWPRKTREIVSAYFDSTRWNDFPFRDDDVIVATWGKSGTTWMQQIAAQIILGPSAGFDGVDASPWLDMRVMPFEPMLAQLQAQKHRRFIKTHLPLDALVFSPKAKYIYVGRDARDVAWSLYNHTTNYADPLLNAFNSPPGLAGQPVSRPTCDAKTFYLRWLDTDEFDAFGGYSSLWSHTQGWWDARHLPNVLLVHFNNLKANLEGEMHRIARFLGVEVKEKDWPALVEHCSFDYMKEQAAKVQGMEMAFIGGGNTFINKGTNGRWKDVLSADEIVRCDEVAAKHLSRDCAYWLKTGELPRD